MMHQIHLNRRKESLTSSTKHASRLKVCHGPGNSFSLTGCYRNVSKEMFPNFSNLTAAQIALIWLIVLSLR